MSHVLIRSGETDFDVEGRMQGTIDLPLTPVGRAEVEAAIETLRSVPVETIYCSPGEPAFSTARLIGRALDVPVKPLEDLDNMHFGLWQGMCINEIRRKQPKVFRQWEESPTTVCPPQGETLDDVNARVSGALKKRLKKDSSFAVVASEPVATLVGCIMRGEEPQLGNPSERPEGLVEIIEPARPETNGAKSHSSWGFRSLTFGLV